MEALGTQICSCYQNSTYLLNIRSFKLTIFNNLFVNFLSFLTTILAIFVAMFLTFLWRISKFLTLFYNFWIEVPLILLFIDERGKLVKFDGHGNFKYNFTKILNPKWKAHVRTQKMRENKESRTWMLLHICTLINLTKNIFSSTK